MDRPARSRPAAAHSLTTRTQTTASRSRTTTSTPIATATSIATTNRPACNNARITVGKPCNVHKTEAGCRTSTRPAASARNVRKISTRCALTAVRRDLTSPARLGRTSAVAFAAAVANESSKATTMKKLISQMVLLLVALGVAVNAKAQQLRDVVKQVDTSVVVVKTVEKNLLTSPQSMFVSSPGSGSGVLIS